MGKHAHLYKDWRWSALRLEQLEREYFCCMCKAKGVLVPADVVDHIKPHRGSTKLFFDASNLQSLCKRHHDSTKQRFERRGYSDELGADGWYVDPKHPANRC